MPVALISGLISGYVRSLMYIQASRKKNNQNTRHTLDSFLEHWCAGAGIIILVISGFLIMADMNRILLLNIHFIGLIITIYFCAYFIADSLITKKIKNLIPGLPDIIDGTIKKYILRTEWNDSGKYLSSQKAAFLIFALLGLCLFVTGAIKTAAFYFGIPVQLTQAATRVHDLTAELLVLMLIVHILFAVFTPHHRRLLKSLFTGKL